MLQKNISIISLSQLKDNYSYLVLKNKKVIIVDPAESTEIIQYIKSNQLNLIAILLTHHHLDHTSGVKKILENFSTPVYSSDHNITHTTNVVKNGDFIDLDFIEMEVINTPGHTLDHIVFYNETNHILFSGDALFRLGCGRIFEGTHKQMIESLNKIKKLPQDTQIYCGHEYTYKNAEFCMKYDSKNIDLKKYFENVKSLRSKKLPTVPTLLSDEIKSNIFLRCDQNDLKAKLNMENVEDYKVFKKVRDLKDVF